MQYSERVGYTQTSLQISTNFDIQYGNRRLSHHPRFSVSAWQMSDGEVLRLVPKD